MVNDFCTCFCYFLSKSNTNYFVRVALGSEYPQVRPAADQEGHLDHDHDSHVRTWFYHFACSERVVVRDLLLSLEPVVRNLPLSPSTFAT